MKDKIDTAELEQLGDYELYLRYDELLDEIYPDCSIAGLSYSTSNALKEIDPTAYRCGFNGWLNSEVSEGLIIEQDDEYYLPN
jgi:hypothetical protein